jgi:exopolysaccharide production protein ExoQ
MTSWRELVRLESGVGPSHAMAFAALVVPILAVHVPLGTVPAFIITAVLVFALSWRRQGCLPSWGLSAGQTLCLLLVLAWALASALLWNENPRQALGTWGGLTALALTASLLLGRARQADEAGRDLIRLGLALGVTIAMLVTFLATFTPMLDPAYAPAHDMFRRFLSRGVNINVLLLGPALIALIRLRRWRWAGGLFLLGVVAVLGSHPLSAKVGLAVITLLFLSGLVWPRVTSVLTLGGVAVVMLSFPLLTALPDPQATSDMWPGLPNSAHHRLTIWKFTADKTLEHPWRGWGLDASRTIPGAEEHVPVWRQAMPPLASGETRYLVEEQRLPLHPHSGPGQVWLELGLTGVVLLSMLLLVTVRSLPAVGQRGDGAMAMAVLGGAVVIASVSFGLWQSWWQASLWLVAIFTAAVTAPNAKQQ